MQKTAASSDTHVFFPSHATTSYASRLDDPIPGEPAGIPATAIPFAAAVATE